MSTSENHAGQSGPQGFGGDNDDRDDDELVQALRDTHFDPDLALAREMATLSMEERNKAIEDVHAVPSEIVEDPEMVQEKLEAFDKEIKKVNNQVYQLAVAAASSSKKNPKYVYVEDVDFRLSFLRTDGFDAKAAARRMLSFLEHKLALFGKETLNRDLRLSDLSEDDMETLKSGVVQVLKEPDSAGRSVLLLIPKLFKLRENDNALRVMMYVYGNLSIEDRKKGVVVVYCNNWEDPVSPIPQLIFKCVKLRNALPCRHSSVHFCFRNNESLKLFCNTAHKLWYSTSLPSTRVRSINHFGTHLEIQYALKGFGLSMNCFPISHDGTVDLKYHQDWIRDRERIEKRSQLHMNDTNPSCQARLFDVGRLQNSPGGLGSLEPNEAIRKDQSERLSFLGKATDPIHHPEINQTQIPCENRANFRQSTLSPSLNDNTRLPNTTLVPTSVDSDGGWDLTSRGQWQSCFDFVTSTAFPGNHFENPADGTMPVISTVRRGSYGQGEESGEEQEHDTPENCSVITEVSYGGRYSDELDHSSNHHCDLSQPLPLLGGRFNVLQRPLSPSSKDNNTTLPGIGLGPFSHDQGGGCDLASREYSQNRLDVTIAPRFLGNDFEYQYPGEAQTPVNSPTAFNTNSQGTEARAQQGHATPEGHGIIPRPEDVLLGRGKPIRNHLGNIRFRKLMEAHAEQYEAAKKFRKALIVQDLVKTVSNAGSRFLKLSHVDKKSKTKFWVVVSPKEAHGTASQYFRSRRMNNREDCGKK